MTAFRPVATRAKAGSFGLAFLLAFATASGWIFLSRSGQPDRETPPSAASVSATPSRTVRTKPPEERNDFQIPGKSYREVLGELEAEDGKPVPGLNLKAFKLSPADSLRALDGLLEEACAQMGGNRAEGIAWLAERLNTGDDEASLTALSGQLLNDEALLRQTLQQMRGKESRIPFAQALLRQWTVQDPEEGFRWLNGLGGDAVLEADHWNEHQKGHLFANYSAEVTQHLLTSGPAKALAAIHAISDSKSCSPDVAANLKRDYLNEMAREDPEGIWKAAMLADNSPQLVRQTLEALAKASPADAARRLGEAGERLGAERKMAEKSLLNEWCSSTQSPQEAFEWMSAHRGEWKSSQPMTIIFGSWFSRDSLKAGDALAALPPGPDRDDGIIGISSTSTDTPPELVQEWIESMSDPAKKERAKANLKR